MIELLSPQLAISIHLPSYCVLLYRQQGQKTVAQSDDSYPHLPQSSSRDVRPVFAYFYLTEHRARCSWLKSKQSGDEFPY